MTTNLLRTPIDGAKYSVSVKVRQVDFENQKRNLDLANDFFDIDSGRFKHEAIRQNDLTTTHYMLLQTQTNYLNVIYAYLVLVVQYKKAATVL